MTKPRTLNNPISPSQYRLPRSSSAAAVKCSCCSKQSRKFRGTPKREVIRVYQFQLGCVRFKMEAKYFRFLKIVGVGFKARAESEGRLLLLKLGHSYEVELTVPPAVRVFCFKPNIICCIGIDKQRTHQFATTVRSCKPPEVYKGKGIMYIDEVIKKQGKKSK
ncbi:Large ribosomal subunit protein uL6m-like protein [Drosera capensis]